MTTPNAHPENPSQTARKTRAQPTDKTSSKPVRDDLLRELENVMDGDIDEARTQAVIRAAQQALATKMGKTSPESTKTKTPKTAKPPLTQRQVAALRPRADPYEVRDSGLKNGYVIVQRTGRLSYCLRYELNGKRAKLTVGAFDPTQPGSLAAIRAQAARVFADVAEVRAGKSGMVDPAAERRAARKAKKAAPTAPAPTAAADTDDAVTVIESYIAIRTPELRSGAAIARRLRRDVIPHWRGKRFADIRRADVVEIRDGFKQRGAIVTSNRIVSILSAMFGWAIERELIENNPCSNVKKTKEKRGERVLTDRELRLIWTTSIEAGWPYGDITRLLMLTGCRKLEIAGMRWSEIDLAAKTRTLPGERVKNGKEHIVHLSPAALEIIRHLPRVNGSDHVFTFSGDRCVTGFSQAKDRLDAAITKLNDGKALESWGLHDLRHASVMTMQALGVEPHVIERVVNHTSGVFAGVAGRYARFPYEKEEAKELNMLADFLERLINDDAPTFDGKDCYVEKTDQARLEAAE